jgi:hypothetical protein
MVISFDLDDTLIPGRKKFETEKRSVFQKLCGIEPIRSGTIALINTLRKQGHFIYIYTTSLRSERRIWLTFYSYGIKLNGVINQKKHEKTLKNQSSLYSKYPPAFKIDIHIDDSAGVEIEGNRYNFKTIIIREDNKNWTNDILRISQHFQTTR